MKKNEIKSEPEETIGWDIPTHPPRSRCASIMIDVWFCFAAIIFVLALAHFISTIIFGEGVPEAYVASIVYSITH